MSNAGEGTPAKEGAREGVSQNEFGHMHAEYAHARRGYPAEVYDSLHALLSVEHPRILDLGCGTGISTRELRQNGFEVVGADKDAAMIKQAETSETDIPYVVAPSERLPFRAEDFDAVTAFSAWHWFNNEASLGEITRVLKDRGIFFAVHKGPARDASTHAYIDECEAIIARYAGEGYDRTPAFFDTDLLRQHFDEVAERSFQFDELYTIEDALKLMRSLSVWNLVSEEDKPRLLEDLRRFYDATVVDGNVRKPRMIAIISGRKRPA